MKLTNVFILICVAMLFATTGCDKKTVKPDPDPIQLSFIVQHASTAGASDGAIDLQVDGGAAPFEYRWANGATTQDISNLAVGMYSVTVTDADNETATDSVQIIFQDNVSSVTDIDGNVYTTVKIGNQWWMAENLRTTHDAQGNLIQSFVYDNNAEHEAIYGKLYNWAATMNGSSQEGCQGIAPDGWHIPTDAEWNVLFNFLGGSAVAGAKLKSTGHTLWVELTENATNETGFSGLPAGGGYANDKYEGVGYGTHYWSSTDSGAEVRVTTLHCDSNVMLFKVYKTHRISVRCIKN
ncbi:hypothetical protein KAR48_09585 [bacterium]|nr:hypothetical protein [bacterium]